MACAKEHSFENLYNLQEYCQERQNINQDVSHKFFRGGHGKGEYPQQFKKKIENTWTFFRPTQTPIRDSSQARGGTEIVGRRGNLPLFNKKQSLGFLGRLGDRRGLEE